MPDTLGTIPVPEITPVGQFPLTTEFPFSLEEATETVIHRFLLGEGRVEQRYLLATKAKVFSFRKPTLCPEEMDALVSFWETNQGAYGAFEYLAPNEDGTYTSYNVRFKDQTLTLEGVAGLIISSGVQFVEIINDTISYTLTGIDIRYPGTTLASQLLKPTQVIIPLIKIRVKDESYPDIFLSDRRCIIGGQLYLPRLLKRGPITLGINSETPPVELVFGNADGVMTALSLATILKKAIVDISFFCVDSSGTAGTKLDYWRGNLQSYTLIPYSPEFIVSAIEGPYELTLEFPTRRATHTCGRIFDSARSGCPYSTFGSGGDPTFCDKGFDTAKGCQSHGMDNFFGGLVLFPQPVRVKDNSTGLFGYGRETLTLTSEIAQSIYGSPLPEIYCDFSNDVDPTAGLLVDCAIIAGRDEGDFYDALGIVGVGPIGDFAGIANTYSPYKLDGQPHHGWPENTFGLRRSKGHNPSQDDDPDHASDKFSLGEGGEGPQRYGATKVGGVAFAEIRRQDTPGLQLSRVAEHTMQVGVRKGLSGYTWTGLGSRSFTEGINNPVWVAINAYLKTLGLWGAPPTSSVDLADQEAAFDPDAAAEIAVNICDLEMPKLIGGQDVGGKVHAVDLNNAGLGYEVGNSLYLSGGNGNCVLQVDAVGQSGEIIYVTIVAPGDGYVDDEAVSTSTDGNGIDATFNTFATNISAETETQFIFDGVIAQGKPIQSWLVQILNTFLGYWTFSFGKLKLGARNDSSVRSAFSIGNVILGSVSFAPREASFNRIVVGFADREYGFAHSAVDYYDQTHAELTGTQDNPTFLPTDINLTGVTRRSHAARYGITRVREEVSGYTRECFQYGHTVRFSTTFLAAEIEAGMVCSIEVDGAPTYPATAPDNTIDPQAAKSGLLEFRINSLTLQPDYSIDVEGVSTHNDVYALVGGPKPPDVISDPLPIELEAAPANWKFQALTRKDGNLVLKNFAVGTNSLSVHLGLFDIAYIDEKSSFYARLIASINDSATLIPYEGVPPREGEYILIEDELMKVVTVEPVVGTDNLFNAVIVERGQLGTVAAAHARIITSILEIDTDFPSKIRVDTGLDLRPGQRLFDREHSVYVDPDGTVTNGSDVDESIELSTGGTWFPPVPQQMITSYDSETGWVYLDRPLSRSWEGYPDAEAQVGDAVYSDRRIWPVKVLHYELSFPPRFFRSSQRTLFEEVIPLPMAGVVTVHGQLENTLGLKSNVLKLFSISPTVLEPRPLPFHPAWPYFVRTLGNERITLETPSEVPFGQYADLFQNIRITDTQSFELAKVSVKYENTLPTPSVIAAIQPTRAIASGRIDISGPISSDLEIKVKIVSRSIFESRTWRAFAYGMDSSTTPEEVAQSLAEFLNVLPQGRRPLAPGANFGAYFTAFAFGPVVFLRDNNAFSGTLQVEHTGDAVITTTGFTSLLGVYTYRRYATAFVNADKTKRSPLSYVSYPSGPLGDFSRVELLDIPDTDNEEVTHVELYATDDGKDQPLYLLATIPIHQRRYADTTPTSALITNEIFQGVLQEVAGEIITVTLKKNGVPWCDFLIPADSNESNIAHGFGLDPVSQDVIINAAIVNNTVYEITVLVELQ